MWQKLYRSKLYSPTFVLVIISKNYLGSNRKLRGKKKSSIAFICSYLEPIKQNFSNTFHVEMLVWLLSSTNKQSCDYRQLTEKWDYPWLTFKLNVKWLSSNDDNSDFSGCFSPSTTKQTLQEQECKSPN